jgi:nucleotide-binding universal stress UspA family protein
MKNILVPYDFSETAFNAVRFAISLAQKSSAVVNLLHVIELPVIPDPLFVDLGDIGAELHTARSSRRKSIPECQNLSKKTPRD